MNVAIKKKKKQASLVTWHRTAEEFIVEKQQNSSHKAVNIF